MNPNSSSWRRWAALWSKVYDRTDSTTGDRGIARQASVAGMPSAVSLTAGSNSCPIRRDAKCLRDKKNVTVSSYLCWKIADPPAMLTCRRTNGPSSNSSGTGYGRNGRNGGSICGSDRSCSKSNSQSRVDRGIAADVATGWSGGPAGESPAFQDRPPGFEQLNGQVVADSSTERLGIELVETGFAISDQSARRQPDRSGERMRTERERIAEPLSHKWGWRKNPAIESQSCRQSVMSLACAEADAERIRGEGEAEAIRILNQAHGARSQRLYEFQRTPATYSHARQALPIKQPSCSRPGSRLFKLLTEGAAAGGQKDETPPASNRPLLPGATAVTQNKHAGAAPAEISSDRTGVR